MLLSELLAGVEVNEAPKTDVNIKSLSCNSKSVGECGLYFCLCGTRSDGHDYAHEALNNGAVAIISERHLPIKLSSNFNNKLSDCAEGDSVARKGRFMVKGVYSDVHDRAEKPPFRDNQTPYAQSDAPQVVVKDSRAAMAKISANFYGNPVSKMKLICVTGTNGKTTTTYMLRSIGESAGKKVGLIGTTAVYIGEEKRPADMTTPDPIALHGIFAEMLQAGCEWVVMEVSAHAIELRKMAGVTADVAVFTNLSQDHLDFFGTLENYRRAKVSYFSKRYAGLAVINADDATGRLILNTADIPCYTYGLQLPADIFAVNGESGADGQKYVINILDKIYGITLNLAGKFNMYNSLAAAGAAFLLGVPLDKIAEGLAALKYVPGRFNTVNLAGKRVVIDYAHTPDGLKNIIGSIKEFKKGRLITVFGCGGNRDRSKRAIMGEIAGGLSDYAVLTSDNPRYEDPDLIIAEIERGAQKSGKPYVCIENRAEAIAHAVKMAGGEDIILICGKGDEPYQEIMGVKHPYSDMDTVKRLLKSVKCGVRSVE